MTQGSATRRLDRVPPLDPDSSSCGQGVGFAAGVVALQGDFREHRAAPEGLGAATREARAAGDSEGIDGLVIPGGGSTSVGTPTDACGLAEPIRRFYRGGAAEPRALHGVRHAAAASVNF